MSNHDNVVACRDILVLKFVVVLVHIQFSYICFSSTSVQVLKFVSVLVSNQFSYIFFSSSSQICLSSNFEPRYSVLQNFVLI